MGVWRSRSFLDDVERIATRAYEPSDGDVVRARLPTTGVQEHRLRFEPDAAAPRKPRRVPARYPLTPPAGAGDDAQEWVIYDVGGARTSVCPPSLPPRAHTHTDAPGRSARRGCRTSTTRTR